MRALIGFNLICFAIALLDIAVMYDGTTKEKITGLLCEVLIMGIISFGAYMMVC